MDNKFEKNYLMGEKLDMEPEEKYRRFTHLADKFEQLTLPCQRQLDWVKSNRVLRREMGLG